MSIPSIKVFKHFKVSSENALAHNIVGYCSEYFTSVISSVLNGI